MNTLLALLGSLPASDSVWGKLSSLDWKKTLRSTLLPGVLAYVAVATIEKLLTDLAGFGLPDGLTAQLVVVIAPTLELLRRKYLSTLSFKQ